MLFWLEFITPSATYVDFKWVQVVVMHDLQLELFVLAYGEQSKAKYCRIGLSGAHRYLVHTAY